MHHVAAYAQAHFLCISKVIIVTLYYVYVIINANYFENKSIIKKRICIGKDIIIFAYSNYTIIYKNNMIMQ